MDENWGGAGGKHRSSNEVLCTHVFRLEKYFYEKQFFITIEKLNIFNRIGGGALSG